MNIRKTQFYRLTYNRTRHQFPLWYYCRQGFLFLGCQNDMHKINEHVPTVAKCVLIWFIWSRVQNIEAAEDCPKVVASVFSSGNSGSRCRSIWLTSNVTSKFSPDASHLRALHQELMRKKLKVFPAESKNARSTRVTSLGNYSPILSFELKSCVVKIKLEKEKKGKNNILLWFHSLGCIHSPNNNSPFRTSSQAMTCRSGTT